MVGVMEVYHYIRKQLKNVDNAIFDEIAFEQLVSLHWKEKR